MTNESRRVEHVPKEYPPNTASHCSSVQCNIISSWSAMKTEFLEDMSIVYSSTIIGEKSRGTYELQYYKYTCTGTLPPDSRIKMMNTALGDEASTVNKLHEVKEDETFVPAQASKHEASPASYTRES